jgi:copper chaperone CopZ
MSVQDEGMATVFRSSGFTAEIEADTVKEVLETNGVQAIVTGLDVLPGAHEVVIQVAAEQKERAERLIAEALEAGPEAAEEAEEASEKP